MQPRDPFFRPSLWMNHFISFIVQQDSCPVPGFRIKEGLSCVLFCAIALQKTRNLIRKPGTFSKLEMFAENSRRRDCRDPPSRAGRSRCRRWRGRTRSLRNISRIHLIITVPPRSGDPPCFSVDSDGSLVNISRLPPSQFVRNRPLSRQGSDFRYRKPQ